VVFDTFAEVVGLDLDFDGVNRAARFEDAEERLQLDQRVLAWATGACQVGGTTSDFGLRRFDAWKATGGDVGNNGKTVGTRSAS